MLWGVIYSIGNAIYADRFTNITDLFDIKYFTIFLIVAIITISITVLLSDKIVSKIRNPYNAKTTSNLLWSSSILLMLLYYVFPNRWYLLCLIVEKLIGSEVNYVSKNILFLTINHNIFLPNIGFIIFVVMVIRLLKQINRNGIESIV